MKKINKLRENKDLFGIQKKNTFIQSRHCVFLIVLILMLILIAPFVSAWWNNDYTSKKEIKVQEKNGTSYTNFQIKLNISYDSDMNNDFSDVRFVNTSDDTEIDYWIQEKYNGQSAIFWVEVPSMVTNKNTSIYMYYGNSGATAKNRMATGLNTFLAYQDNSTTSNWTCNGGGTITDWQNYLHLEITDSTKCFVVLDFSETEVVWEMKRAFYDAIGSTTEIMDDGGYDDAQSEWKIEESADFLGVGGNHNVDLDGGTAWASKVGNFYYYKVYTTFGTVNSSSYYLYDNGYNLVGSANKTGNARAGVTNISNIGVGESGGGTDQNNSYDWIIYRKYLNITKEPTSVFGTEEKNTAQLSVTVTLISPSSGVSLSETQQNFTINHTAINGNLTNTTLYVWYSNNTLFETNFTTVTGNSTNTTILSLNNIPQGNDYKWNSQTCIINSTDTLCSFADSNFTFSIVPFEVTSQSFENNVFETSSQIFNIEIDTLDTVTSVTSRFLYNGTYYSSNPVDLGNGNYNITNTIDIPLASNDGNKTFKWEFNFTLTDGEVLTQNSSTYSHKVNRTYLRLCNATYSTNFVNFSSYNAENPFPVVNATFKSAWEWWLGGGSVSRNYSYEDVSENNHSWGFCGYPIDQTYNVNAHIETDGNGYSLNNYYLEEATLNNATQNISLYLLNDTKATLTVLRVVDTSQREQEDVIIQIQLYDVGTDTFYTVAMAKTAFNGEDIAYLNWYNSLYKFIFIKDGNVVKTVDPFRISETPQIFTIEDDEEFIYEKFLELAYNLYYNSITQNFVLTFTKPSGEVEMGCLRVVKRGATADTEICNVCETSSSATLYCNIANSGNGTYIATFYATGSFWSFGSIVETIGGTFASSIYDLLGNDDASFYALIFAGVVVFMMFISLPIGIVAVLLGIVGGAALGFQTLSWGVYTSMVIIGGIIIWLVKR